MNTATHLRLAALSGFVAVAIGAFAAHGLKGRLPPAMFDVLQTAVQYQFYHSLAWLLVLVLALRSAPSLWLRLSARCFGAGILLFSGSLYVLALGGIHRFGMVTPLGAPLSCWAGCRWRLQRGLWSPGHPQTASVVKYWPNRKIGIGSMRIQVNGDTMELRDGSSLADLVEKLGLGDKRIAAEVNLEIVPRSEHRSLQLSDGDRVEIVHAIGGG
ncbi:sulfur carrier protein ThiS [Marinobacterium aestuariivivens]|uniref:Sulfur carrier protein ThiS n=1 Tax=Marinobacterium aestuariivivens TaxID=1698799 RepID=A0ABW1ZYX5_9GAMM